MDNDKDKNKNKSLEDQVKDLIQQVEDHLKTAKTENEELTDRKIDELKKDFSDRLNDHLKRIRENNVSVPGLEEPNEQSKFSFARAASGVLSNNWKGAGYEKEVFDAAEDVRTKAMGTNTGGSGGFLVPTELAEEKLLKPALADVVLKELGVKIWTGLIANLEIPELKTRPSIVWTGEGASQSAQDLTFGLKRMVPREGGILTQINNKVLLQTNNVIDSIVRTAIHEALSDGMDLAGINGAGGDHEPTGILNWPNLGTSTALSGRFDVDTAASMIADVRDLNYMKKKGKGGILTKPRVVSGLKRERVAQYSGDTGGQPLIHPLMTDAMLEDTLRLKVRDTTNVPYSTGTLTYVVVGDWAYFAIGLWGGIKLKSSQEAGTAFASNQTWLVVFLDMDTLVLQPNAFNIGTGAETNESNW